VEGDSGVLIPGVSAPAPGGRSGIDGTAVDSHG
jgi:hypothetical protein